MNEVKELMQNISLSSGVTKQSFDIRSDVVEPSSSSALIETNVVTPTPVKRYYIMFHWYLVNFYIVLCYYFIIKVELLL